MAKTISSEDQAWNKMIDAIKSTSKRYEPEQQNVYVPIKDADSYMKDEVNHPEHYTKGKIEVFDALDDWSEAGMIGYCVSNVIKYLTRYRSKGNPLQDLKKARWYLDREIEKYEQKGDTY